MPKYYGCPCEGCGKPLTLQDDIVVCPDCGAPYHRVCYEKLGQCIHRPAHAAGYEWKFPYEESQLRTCPSCGERTLRDEETCRCCGAVLPPEGQEPPSSRGSGEETFDYSQMYRQFGTSADPEKEFLRTPSAKRPRWTASTVRTGWTISAPPLPLTSPLTAGCSSRRARYP